MKNYLIIFRNQPSIIVEAPNSSMAMGCCISRIDTYAEISDSHMKFLVDECGLKFVKWPF